MKARHSYVVVFQSNIDQDPAKTRETMVSAKALYERRCGPSVASGAVNVSIREEDRS
jgi:hypothetical protein